MYGWLNGTTFEGIERGDPYNLAVGFIKGTQLSISPLTLNAIGGTAGKLLRNKCTMNVMLFHPLNSCCATERVPGMRVIAVACIQLISSTSANFVTANGGSVPQLQLFHKPQVTASCHLVVPSCFKIHLTKFAIFDALCITNM